MACMLYGVCACDCDGDDDEDEENKMRHCMWHKEDSHAPSRVPQLSAATDVKTKNKGDTYQLTRRSNRQWEWSSQPAGVRGKRSRERF
jgi:hypothetical protein